MSDIPLARDRLAIIAANIRAKGCFSEAKEIGVIIVDLLTREKASRRTPHKNKSVTGPIKTAVKAYARQHPRASQAEIGLIFGINAGRVSEILNGKR